MVADVAIVGAGFTGLWTAYYLAKADPSLKVVVLEAETAGFGASGRNGGWASALFPTSLAKVAAASSREAAVALDRAMVDTVDEVGRATAAEGIDCHFRKGGTVVLARTPVQLERARTEVAEQRSWGFGPERLDLLDADAARARLGATDVLGATYTPDCASIHPARLVRGLALAVERLGVVVHEGTRVTSIEPGVVRTTRGDVVAARVVRATEAWSSQLPGSRRDVAPVYSLVLATEPLPASFWDEVGLRHGETFADHRHLIIYGQRTADDRLVFGGRGAPYHLRSRIRPEFDREPAVFAELWRVLRDLFPAVEGHAVTHTWGGPLGIPRDWFPSVGLDETTGIGWAGGYVGDGVASSNLAGRTLADLVRGERSDITRLPWVNHRSPAWEPEPLRWLGVNLGLRVMGSADGAEERTGKPSRRAELFAPFLGGH
ncbi:MAG: FAD-dependent oxidoreductase [Frankiales bacterium]|nr:FAD-dependent oxidoreductase [Frankiales bacterium]